MEGQLENSDTIRVASFSAYLNSSDDNIVLKLTGAARDPALDIFSPEETPRLVTITKGRGSKEGELGVFGADKYFNTKLGYHHHTPNTETRDGDKIEVYRYMSPSATSESSCNSQSVLLKNPSCNKQKKAFFSGFACSGPCLDKKAVHVNEDDDDNSLVHTKGPRRESFRFVTTVKPEEKYEFAKPKSIDDVGSNLERKLAMLTWDAIPKSQTTASTFGGPCDEIQSEASSDLFEIDPISGNGYTLLDHVMPQAQYEPSEASIEWSVVTASAADFSVASDYDEKVVYGKIDSRNSSKSKNIVRKEGLKSRPGGLLGCNNHKAVSVAEGGAYKVHEKAKTLTPRKEKCLRTL